MKHYTTDDLIDYLHGELAAAADARIHAHLAECADCRALYEAEAALGDMLRAAARADEREFPSIVKARVWEAVRNEEPTALERLRAIFRPVVAVPLAAALALVAYFGVPAVRGTNVATGAPTVAAAYYLEEHAAEGQENPLADHTNVHATFAAERSATPTTAPLIDAADAATLSGDIVIGI